MRRALITPARARALRVATVPAPYKGWDATAPLEDMDPATAIVLDNFFPEPGYVRVRGGHVEHATGLGSGPVESLFAWRGPAGSEKLFGACGGSIYNVTNPGPVGTADLTGLTNARWQHAHHTTAGGNFLFIVNGADAPRHYNGTTWATPTITGITASEAIHVNSHQRRLWLTLNNSTKAAYLPVDSVAGAASVIDLGPLFSRGGYLVGMATWTIDAGLGMDDYAVFISSAGQVALFAGTDPANSSTWALKGVYDLGPPIGRRCFVKAGGDLALLTVDGIVPLSTAISFDRAASRRIAITARIQRAMNEAARKYAGNFGWQMFTYPRGSAVKLNVPVIENNTIYQYVLNTITGAWCRYVGMNAACWELFQDRPFFGGLAGKVYEADKSGRDAGQLIRCELKTAFNHLRERGSIKQFLLARPLITTNGQVRPSMTVNVDYGDKPVPDAMVIVPESEGFIWNQFNWNDGSLWGGGLTTSGFWQSIDGIGECVAMRMAVLMENQNPETAIDLRLTGFELRYQLGSGI